MHVQWNLRKVVLPEDLADTTIVILGLWQMGYTDINQIADILHIRRLSHLNRLIRLLKTTKNPVIRRCVDVGLPPGLHREIPTWSHVRSVRCPLCKMMVDTVPCPKCSSPRWLVAECDQDDEADRKRPKRKTNARPGSLEKIEVMRKRLERGEAVHHPKDATINPDE